MRVPSMSKLSFLGGGIPALLLVACLFSFMTSDVFAERLLVVGNSLTKHGPALDKEWPGDWGMAASSAENDFVHLLVAKLEAHTQNSIEASIIPGYPIEKVFFDNERPQLLASVDDQFEYIVIEIGDNIDFSHIKKELFEKRYSNLIDSLNKKLKPNGVLVCVGKWWPNDWVDDRIRSACEARGGKFVSLKHISAQTGAKASEERTIANSGVGAHPGDRAMREISELIFCAITNCSFPSKVYSNSIDVGVFYFPGWYSQSRYWRDLRGLPDSRSPNAPWPDREPLLGYYAEEDIKVAEQHIEWASQYGVTFFAYDWYWDGKSTYLNHAVDNFLKAPNNSKLKFSLLWANHSDVPRSLKEFDVMVDFWMKHYLVHPQFYRIEGKPVIFIFSNGQLEMNAKKFGWSANALLKRADDLAKTGGLPGLYFVATTNARPSDTVEMGLAAQGFSAYSGWNYVVANDASPVADYQSMVDTYLDFYGAAKSTKGRLPYIAPASPGWDSRPWGGKIFRVNPTPEKFKQMLLGAKELIDSNKSNIPHILMVEAWNEFGEGAYIEPTKQWGFQYLEAIKNVFENTHPTK